MLLKGKRKLNKLMRFMFGFCQAYFEGATAFFSKHYVIAIHVLAKVQKIRAYVAC